jgi:glucosamine--fructose-6-phosphate aminotransferase (isomerizing)
MCGIIGYVGKKQAQGILVDGLKRMEYRGYDSAGIAVMERDGIACIKKQGKISKLEQALRGKNFKATVGIGHTRWATHGIPSDRNAHPHSDCEEKIFIVHNGIIENSKDLRKKLAKKGHTFRSDTDSELVAHLIEDSYKKHNKLEQAVAHALKQVTGTYGLAIMSDREPEKIVAARLGSPLVIGVTHDGEYIVASDVAAILRHTREVVYMEDHEMAVLEPRGYRIMSATEKDIGRGTERVEWDIAQVEKNGFDHFLLKEIFEQPEVLSNAIQGRMDIEAGDAHLGGIQDVAKRLAKIQRIIIVACGAAYYAGLVGKQMIEEYAGIPVEVAIGSEFRYSKAVLDDKTAAIFISQSGETADTLGALKEVKKKGILSLGIVNVVGSSIARDSDAGVYIHAGPEISVSTTKAFMNQMGILALLTVFLGRQRSMSYVTGRRILEELNKIPKKIELILKQKDAIKKVARKYKNMTNALVLGRKYNLPVALEEALKLKEISYVHAEAYSAGEMKHGPIALIDKNFPVITITPKDSVYEKSISNLQEIKARKGRIIAVATEGDKHIKELADDVLYIPKTLEMFNPLLSVVPLQLFAYYSALLRGHDVDQPRNLAKSVTVE